jgi:beta-glucosidase
MEDKIYLDPSQPVERRVKDLIGRMTLKEKTSQMLNASPAIPRLGVPEYDWWNECLHGVARAGIATVFPQAIGLASTWNVDLVHQVAVAISDEARAKHHQFLRQGDRSRYTGLTHWSPNINIFRDPRWGRGQETYGEDPHLTARLGVAFVKGLQGDHEHYLKLVATPKHYAVHSGPENERHRFDVHPTPRDLEDTYLPAFKACVQEGHAVSIMGAYNRVNGEPCCASPALLEGILRQEWGFAGYVVSDCGAIDDIYRHHAVVKKPSEAAALAVKAGCDLNCGDTYLFLTDAVDKGLISEAELDRSLVRLFTARFRLGMFDSPEQVPYAQIPFEVNDSPAHQKLALQAARQSIVLLKNDGLLPLSDSLERVAVIGPNAADVEVLLGNYNGTPSQPVTILEGLRRRLTPGTEVLYARGCDISGPSRDGFVEAANLAHQADVAIVVLGLSQLFEGEEGQQEGLPRGQRSFGDRTNLDLPGVQEDLLKSIQASGTPTVLVLLNGSPISINWAAEHTPAILEAWYPGQSGGTAVAEVLFGDTNPAGRLPVTFHKSVDQLPPFDDYSMNGRTYRYFRGEPLYPFGFGLSYTTFEYRNFEISPQSPHIGDTISVRVEVKNIGGRPGDEVAQLYFKQASASPPDILPAMGNAWQLKGFERLHLKPGEAKTVVFTLLPEHRSLVSEHGQRLVVPGEALLAVGGWFPGQGMDRDIPAGKNTSNILVCEFTTS